MNLVKQARKAEELISSLRRELLQKQAKIKKLEAEKEDLKEALALAKEAINIYSRRKEAGE